MPRYTEISHFRAPYKDAMFAGIGQDDDNAYEYVNSAEGYGVYGSDDDLESGSDVTDASVQDSTDASVQDSTDDSGSGPGMRANPWKGQRNPWKRGKEGMLAMWGRNPWSGIGDVDVDLKTLDPFFTVTNNITVATDLAAKSLTDQLAQWGIVDPAMVMPTDAKTTTVVFYHQMTTPPAGSEPGPYMQLAQALTALVPTVGKPAVVYLQDKRLMVPAPGKRTIVVTSDPQVVATLAGPGGSHFVTKDADPTILAAASKMVSGGLVTTKASLLSSPLGIGLIVVAIAGVAYFASQGKGKSKRAY